MSTHNKRIIAASLATATCSLLGTSVVAPVQAQEDPGWDFNTALLYYGESDGRVQDVSLNVLARRAFVDDRFLTLGLAVDTLTGATPSGALAYDGPQTFTRPSGLATYTTPANQTPLDDSFLDTRVALTAGWQQPFARLYSFNVGLSASKEYDYLHLGANLGLSRDFNKRNTTLSLGVAFSQDDLEPVGGAPLPLSAMLDVGDLSNRSGDQSKDVTDLVLGLTQVINRDLLVQLNYSFSKSTGYLNDPYKFLSVVDGSTGDPISRTPAPGDSGPLHEYRFESRPDERSKHSVYGQAKYNMSGKVLDLSYRYMSDDWDIDSHTLEARYRWPFGDRRYLEPHVRYYTQSAAEFYRIGLVDGATPPRFASSDYRLGDFDAMTVGLKYGWKTRSDNDMSIRLEYYTQDGSAPSDQIIGNQAGRVLYPDLDAIIA
ncbi:MAG: DUF3570 domain-containing protein, partial [Gammaproteobacteria bacterium]|nr:DUF3570 domain-containing protein [Gammaproteobacteria bacterium]